MTVAGKRQDRVENVPVLGIRFSLFDEGGDHGDHLRDMVGGFGLYVGQFDVQFAHVFIESLNVLFGHFLPGSAFFFGPVDDFIVDVGEVAHVVHLIP